MTLPHLTIVNSDVESLDPDAFDPIAKNNMASSALNSRSVQLSTFGVVWE